MVPASAFLQAKADLSLDLLSLVKAGLQEAAAAAAAAALSSPPKAAARPVTTASPSTSPVLSKPAVVIQPSAALSPTLSQAVSPIKTATVATTIESPTTAPSAPVSPVKASAVLVASVSSPSPAALAGPVHAFKPDAVTSRPPAPPAGNFPAPAVVAPASALRTAPPMPFVPPAPFVPSAVVPTKHAVVVPSELSTAAANSPSVEVPAPVRPAAPPSSVPGPAISMTAAQLAAELDEFEVNELDWA
jgi:hypothetical protein